MMVAHVCDLSLGEFIHSFGDAHSYIPIITNKFKSNFLENKPLPKDDSQSGNQRYFCFKYDDFNLTGYDPHPLIKGKVAI